MNHRGNSFISWSKYSPNLVGIVFCPFLVCQGPERSDPIRTGEVCSDNPPSAKHGTGSRGSF